VAALILGVSCGALWFALGANRGWTKTTRTHMEKDAVTDLPYPVIEKHFSPGVEMLGAGLLISAALAGISFAFKRKPKH
jgi:hypothetical protein